MLGYNFAILGCTLPFRTQQNFAGLNSAGLYYTEQNYASMDITMLDSALLHSADVGSAPLRCDVTLLSLILLRNA